MYIKPKMVGERNRNKLVFRKPSNIHLEKRKKMCIFKKPKPITSMIKMWYIGSFNNKIQTSSNGKYEIMYILCN